MAGTLYRDLVALLKAANCRFVRQAGGSHEFWSSPPDIPAIHDSG